MVNPKRILFLLLFVQALLLGVVLLCPTGKVKIGGAEFRFVSLEKLLNSKSVKFTDISHILLREAADTLGNPTKDSLMPGEEKVKDIPYKLQFPDGKPYLLDAFFRSLDSIKAHKNLVRIVHYGDSQIEGDRISGVIRDLLQDQFGGCGPGLLPISEVADMRNTVRISQSDNWKKFAIYGGLYKGVGTKNYGLLGSFFRYFGFVDSNGVSNDTAIKNAWVTYTRSGAAYRHAQRFENVKLFYGNVNCPTTTNLITNGKIYKSTQLKKQDNFVMQQWKMDTLPWSIGFSFSSLYSPNIFGVSLDGNSGVVLDNVGMRGSSGTDFTRIDAGFLSMQLKATGVKLLILQFGVNVVPYLKDNFEYYEKEFYRQLKYIKDHNPDVCIIVIGTSDMAMKEGTDYVSYPNIEGTRDAQRRAAFKAGCVYWDLFQAMGGKNSMVSWVNEEPALAEKDYTHFNPKGAKIIGEMVYKSIMNNYYWWEKNKKK
ncbi:MAG: GDSL-type esterase/lipase family protein [Bacteroidetes bacterium]|nr:GDSL-type esterase/lipase family protein [Bacteroidota bacterium]